MTGQLQALHPQLPKIFESEDHLHCRILSAVSNQQWASHIYTNPPEALQPLLDQLQLAAVYADKHNPYKPTTPKNKETVNISSTSIALPSFLTNIGRTPSEHGYEYEISTNENDPDALPSESYYVLRRFRRNFSVPPRSFHLRSRRPGSFRGPSHSQPCSICRSPNHWARECPNRTRRHSTTPSNIVDLLTTGDTRSVPTLERAAEEFHEPPPIDPLQYLQNLASEGNHTPPIGSSSWVRSGSNAVWATPTETSEPTTAETDFTYRSNHSNCNHRLLDTCTEHDLIGENCFLTYYDAARQYYAPTARFSFGRDTPPTIASTTHIRRISMCVTRSTEIYASLPYALTSYATPLPLSYSAGEPCRSGKP